jgi:two-component system phosphate regulon response regulator PhoB
MAKTILVVDDDAAIRRMLKVNLEQEGFRIVTANNGREALFVLRE